MFIQVRVWVKSWKLGAWWFVQLRSLKHEKTIMVNPPFRLLECPVFFCEICSWTWYHGRRFSKLEQGFTASWHGPQVTLCVSSGIFIRSLKHGFHYMNKVKKSNTKSFHPTNGFSKSYCKTSKSLWGEAPSWQPRVERRPRGGQWGTPWNTEAIYWEVWAKQRIRMDPHWKIDFQSRLETEHWDAVQVTNDSGIC